MLDMSRRRGRPTRGDAIYALLRRDIVTGAYRPGAKLAFHELGERYSASTGVLREVLPRLVEQGLVESGAQLGFRVVSLSDDTVRHLTEARVVVESVCLGEAIRSATIEWESGVVAAHHTLSRSPRSDDDGTITVEWLDAHAHFHAALLSGAGNTVLRRLAESLRAVAELARRRPEPWAADDRDLAGEHQRIASAALARDEHTAVTELIAHLRLTGEQVLQARAAAGEAAAT